MADRKTLLALAARVEQAQGPDRELDFEIAAAVGWPDSPIMRQNARRYTDSLDNALTLVPEGHAISLHVDADGSVFAGVMRDDGDGCDNADRCGATPALALCAAALRARAEDLPHG